MTFDELNGITTEQLAALSDEELAVFIGDIVKDEPIPKPISVVQKFLDGSAEDDCPIKKAKKKSGLKLESMKDKLVKMNKELDEDLGELL